MFFHTETRALPIGPQAKACGLLDNARQDCESYYLCLYENLKCSFYTEIMWQNLYFL